MRLQFSLKDRLVPSRFVDDKREKNHAADFRPSEQIHGDKDIKQITQKRGNMAAMIKDKDKVWQRIVDRLNVCRLNYCSELKINKLANIHPPVLSNLL